MSSRSVAELLLCRISTPRMAHLRSRLPCSYPQPSYRTITSTSPSQAAQPQPEPKEIEEEPQTDTPFRIRRTNQRSPYPGPSNPSSPSPPQGDAQSQPTSAIDAFFSTLNNSPRKPQSNNAADNNDNDTNHNAFAPRRPQPSTPQDASAQGSRVFGAGFSRPSSSPLGRRRLLDFDAMLLPSSDSLPPLQGSVQEQRPSATQLSPAERARLESEKHYPRLNPSYGRAVELDPAKGKDLVRGISLLGSMLARNRVKKDLMRQRFHERPGLKRKRLNSERWRARFKVGFGKVVARVSELNRKGW